MKRILTLMMISVIAFGMMTLTACKPSSFGLNGESVKLITVEAENADIDDTATSGGMQVAEGEQVVITSALEVGSVKIEIFAGPDEQSADEIPMPEGDPVIVFNASGNDMEAATVDEGYYFVKATVTEKATGSVQIEVLPMEAEQWNTAESTDDAGDKAP